jgi:hypothetical protein
VSRKPKVVVQLSLDTLSVLVFALFTFSMVRGFFQVQTMLFHVFTAAFAALGLYFLARGVLNLGRTWLYGASLRE